MEPIKIIYEDDRILVCVKPAGILSTDEPGGLPGLLRQQLGDEGACVRTVHRLDRVVSGLMVLARTPEAASELARQVRDREFDKEYLAVIHGCPQQEEGAMTDLLCRDKAERKTYVTRTPGKDARLARLTYRVLARTHTLSRVRIRLETGRTHQIRCQFSSRGFPLVGDRKYSLLEDDCPIALWSCRLVFCHPSTGKPLDFYLDPPKIPPWDQV